MAANVPQDALVLVFRCLLSSPDEHKKSSYEPSKSIGVYSLAPKLLASCECVCHEWHDVVRGELLSEDWVSICKAEYPLEAAPGRDFDVRVGEHGFGSRGGTRKNRV